MPKELSQGCPEIAASYSRMPEIAQGCPKELSQGCPEISPRWSEFAPMLPRTCLELALSFKIITLAYQ